VVSALGRGLVPLAPVARVDSRWTAPRPIVFSHPPQESEHEMSELILYVSGMSCRRCVREVTARLRDVAGVETVTADAGRSHIRLNGSMTLPDVVRAFAGSTYRPEVVENGLDNADATRDEHDDDRGRAAH
jgi:copper chaperone CopZ